MEESRVGLSEIAKNIIGASVLLGLSGMMFDSLGNFHEKKEHQLQKEVV